ncbi:hypothetical protein DJ568_16115 [Mucilaginibacter hurinus]|uniref:Uncharacterized protein n=1 Tax=Mucilaginibacter hurinus TaxID=2201324 RepID=A0A367GJY1_9SPHI|nr:hypothetical protein [Mucilaginibacter hurinus]RCH53762.1 hypothetical protein DJ568_16115 [Mucilaginibacter hurinus]
MIESGNISPAEKDGRYEFRIYYSEQERLCRVEKEQNTLHVSIDNGTEAKFQINNDGTVQQIDGTPLPESIVEYIKKHILEH